MTEKLTEPSEDEMRPSRIKNGRSQLLIGVVIILVVLLVVASSAAVYYASNRKSSQTDSSDLKTMVLDKSTVIAAPGGLATPVFAFAGTFSAPEPGYLIVTGESMLSNYSIALEIVMNNTSPDSHIPLSNGTDEPLYYIRSDSVNATLVTSPFNNDFSLLPVLRGNVSIYVESSNGANIGVVLNATYYY